MIAQPPAAYLPTAPLLPAALQAFDEALVARSPATRYTYRSSLRQFVRYLVAQGARPDVLSTAALPPTIAQDYHTYLLGTLGRSRRTTIITYLAALRAFLRFLDRRDWLPPGVSFERIRDRLAEQVGRGTYRTPRIDQRVPLIVVAADTLPLPEAPNARLILLRDRALLHVLYSSGLRRAEVCALNRADLDAGVPGEVLVTGKGDKDRLVFLDADALAAVAAYLTARQDHYQALFLRHDRSREKHGPARDRWRMGGVGMWKTVQHYARLAGVTATPHVFRHAFASSMLNAGARLDEVQDLLGHASPETTKRIYAHYDRAHIRSVYARCHVGAAEAAGALEAPA